MISRIASSTNLQQLRCRHVMSVPQDLRNLDVTEKDRIRKEQVRGSLKVAPVTKKIGEKRLEWYGHDKRRDGGGMC